MNSNDSDESTFMVGQERARDGLFSFLRTAAVIAVGLGAIGSEGLMLREGRNSPPILLLLFGLWVPSPFIGLLLVNLVSKRWSRFVRVICYSAMLMLTLAALIIYGIVTLSPHMKAPTAVFLLVPLGSWLITGLMIAISAFISGRQYRHEARAKSVE